MSVLKRHVACVSFLIACGLAACSNGGGIVGPPSGGGGGNSSPSPLPSGGIGIGIPTGSIGVENDPTWGTVSGYTQEKTTQVLAFPPGTKVTLQNLSSDNPHTLNVIALAPAPPANFPANPPLSFNKSGTTISKGYASGIINPGGKITLTLTDPGIYLIGCAFHYSIGMRDVIQIAATASPGPTASPGTGGF
jgi:plastocyanin